MKVKIKSNNKKVITELTEEEYSFVQEALDIPKSELPFSNIFGDRYRVLGDFQTVNENHPLSKIIEFLEDRGWSIEPHVDKQPLKFTKSYNIIAPSKDRKEIDSTPRTKTITLTMQKIIQNMVNAFNNSLPSLYKQYQELKDQSKEAENPADKDKIAIQQVLVAVKLRNLANLYLNSNEFYSGEDMLSIFLSKKANQFYEITTDEAQMYKWQESFSGLYKPAYVIFSRHPVDVYRMSDFTEITSCHSPPSRKGESTKFDQFNICALAEAWANGMISYVVTEEEFNKANIQPTQEAIDKYEDRELFWDRQRGEGALVPRSRIRIRNTSYTDPDSGAVTQIAIPDQKVYGKDVAGFKEYVRNYIGSIQKDSIQKIYQNEIIGSEDGVAIISLDNFERFGGSYEDAGMAVHQNLPLMFASALGLESTKIESSGHLKYDKSFQNELRDRTEDELGSSLDMLQIQADEEAAAASRNTRWHFDVSLNQEDYDDQVYVEEILLTVFAILPESVNVGDNYTAINEAFEEYINRFNLYWGNEEIEPDSIAAYAPSTFMTHNFTTPFIAIRYPDLARISSDNGDTISFGELSDTLENMADTSRNGGLNLALVTDPYIEDAFDAVAKDICALRGFYDDPEWYLNQVYHQTIDESNWLVDSVSEGETNTMLEIIEEVSYDTIMNIDLKELISRGEYTPKQAAAILIAIGESEDLQQWLIREINKECQIAVGNGETFINNNETVIPFTIDGPQTYQTVEDVVADIDSGAEDHFQLKMTITKDQINSKAKFLALYSLLSQYDQDEMATLILAYSDEIKNLFPAEPQAVTENKRRMKIRMLRG